MFGCCAHRGGKRADKNVFVNIFFGGERDFPASPMEKLPASTVETESEKEKLLREKELEKENLLPALARYRAAQEAAQNGSDVAVIELPRLRELHAADGDNTILGSPYQSAITPSQAKQPQPLSDFERSMYRIGGAEAFASEVASTARVWQSTGRLSENTVAGETAALDGPSSDTYGDEDGKFGSDALHSWALAAIDADDDDDVNSDFVSTRSPVHSPKAIRSPAGARSPAGSRHGAHHGARAPIGAHHGARAPIGAHHGARAPIGARSLVRSLSPAPAVRSAAPVHKPSMTKRLFSLLPGRQSKKGPIKVDAELIHSKKGPIKVDAEF